MTEKVEQWFTATRVAAIGLILNIVFVIYMGLIQNNDLKNLVKVHDEKIDKIEISITKLEEKKLDKETFSLILTTLVDLKTDIRDIKTDLNTHINK